jgi:hypothetical protein
VDLSDAPTSATLRGRNRLVSRSPLIWSGPADGIARSLVAITERLASLILHARITPADRRADLARNTGAYAARLVSFLMRAVGPD